MSWRLCVGFSGAGGGAGDVKVSSCGAHRDDWRDRPRFGRQSAAMRAAVRKRDD